MLTRRDVLASFAATMARRVSPAAPAEAFPEERYGAATVIDACAGLWEYVHGAAAADEDHPVTDGELAAAKQSGVTAIQVTAGPVGNGPRKFEEAIAGIARLDGDIAAHPEALLKVQRAGDLALAKKTGRLGFIYCFQDSSMLEGDLGRLEQFKALGLRVCQPAYNVRGLIADGCLEPADGGLSRLGHRFIEELNRLRLVLDLSHAGRRTIAEGIARSKAPVVISHTGCRALVDVPRNTEDASLRALAVRGGVAGIYFMPFLRASGQQHAQDVVRHLEHAVNVCGEDHVGLGTDGNIPRTQLDDEYRSLHRKFVEGRMKAGISAPGESPDVFVWVPEYNDPRRFKTLADDLVRRGWSVARIEKVLGANFARVYAEVWGT